MVNGLALLEVSVRYILGGNCKKSGLMQLSNVIFMKDLNKT